MSLSFIQKIIRRLFSFTCKSQKKKKPKKCKLFESAYENLSGYIYIYIYIYIYMTTYSTTVQIMYKYI